MCNVKFFCFFCTAIQYWKQIIKYCKEIKFYFKLEIFVFSGICNWQDIFALFRLSIVTNTALKQPPFGYHFGGACAPILRVFCPLFEGVCAPFYEGVCSPIWWWFVPYFEGFFVPILREFVPPFGSGVCPFLRGVCAPILRGFVSLLWGGLCSQFKGVFCPYFEGVCVQVVFLHRAGKKTFFCAKE